MALSNAERQAEYRASRKRARDALAEIAVFIERSQKPWADDLRVIIRKGLG